ncbi:MucB/RseB C-terminal domain-containing protein [Otariodibacter sp.]|uniref:MucB/RseB C-terminal domain-containing protein n=1 Tax=Otariodibacter sp. TaxID=3030919 RepID=UPI002613A95B|nr:MucB/RseB C-terminal domain-containing protein [Otariodibacter sp.]
MMKIYKVVTFLLLLGMSVMGFAEGGKTPIAYLNAMTSAHKMLNYELFYLVQQGEQVDSLRYRHANYLGKEYAQLLQLDKAREEIILRDNRVSYFGEFQPFSLASNHILDNLPILLYTDFNQLDGYNFIDVGRERVANRLARVIRIVPKDDFRYQHEIWIDEENYLLLRADLLDRDGNILEQFKVLKSTVDNQFMHIIEPITSLILPSVIVDEKKNSPSLNWEPKWIPQGFKKITSGTQRLSGILIENEQVESQLYSDGLVSFTIYLVQNKGIIFNEQFWRQGKISIYSQTIGDKDVVIVGEIPLVSARHIVQDIQQNQPIKEAKQ